MINEAAIEARQQRFASQLGDLDAEIALLLRSESVQWLTGAYVGPQFPVAAAITSEAEVTLVLPSRKVESPAIAKEVVPYTEKRLSTMCDSSEQRLDSIQALLDSIGPIAKRPATELSLAPQQLLAASSNDWIDVDPLMYRLRRCKDADELGMLAKANEANGAMYARARELIEPGLNELDLYNELHKTAVRTLGEALTYFGQDFRANARGGSPRDRCAQGGELWILDLGVGYRGYHSDNARTIAVGEPSAAQRKAHARIADVFPMIEATARPGVRCAELYEKAKQMLAGDEPWVFNHHLGHSVGLSPHEAPRLNPNWDDVLEPGNFLAVEPGLYCEEELQHGIRLENNYIVTESGVELVTDWSMELTTS